jgi:hypothetical protein
MDGWNGWEIIGVFKEGFLGFSVWGRERDGLLMVKQETRLALLPPHVVNKIPTLLLLLYLTHSLSF